MIWKDIGLLDILAKSKDLSKAYVTDHCYLTIFKCTRLIIYRQDRKFALCDIILNKIIITSREPK